LKIQNPPQIAIHKVKHFVGLISLPWHEPAADCIGNIWVCAIALAHDF
jgi:hypothetical protein